MKAFCQDCEEELPIEGGVLVDFWSHVGHKVVYEQQQDGRAATLQGKVGDLL